MAHLPTYKKKQNASKRERNQLPRWSASAQQQADAEVWVVQTSTEWAAECRANGMPEEEAPRDMETTGGEIWSYLVP